MVTLSTIPFTGGIASLIDEYVPKSGEKSLSVFLSELDNRVKILEERIDLETVNKDEFAKFTKSCYWGVVKTTQEEKIKIFAAMFTNLLLKDDDPDKASYSELDHFVRAMDTVSIGALRVIMQLSILCNDPKQNRLDFTSLYQGYAEEIPPALYMSLLQELNSLYIVEITVPSVKVDTFNNYVVELTYLGNKFIERYCR